MDFINTNFESTTHFAPTTTPQYNTAANHHSAIDAATYTSAIIEKAKRTNDGSTDIILIGKKPQGGAEFLVYGNKKNGLANDIAAVLSKIVAERTHVSGENADVYIADLKREKRFIEEEIDLELGTY